MSHKHTYIEFVGQHSAGKTTTIQRVVEDGILAPTRVVYPQLFKRNNLHFMLMTPLLFIVNARHVWFLTVFILRYTKCNWINYHAVFRHLYKMIVLHPYYDKTFSFDVMLKDDMVHLLPRVDFKDGVDVEVAFTTFISHFSYRFNGLVYMELPYEEMAARFEERFNTRPTSRKKSRKPVYERAYQQNQILKKVLCAQTMTPVLILQGTEPIETNVQKVTEFIRTYIS